MAIDTTERAPQKNGRHPAPSTAGAEPDDAVKPVRTRRPWGLGFAAFACVVAAGLGSMFLYGSLQHTERAFTVTATVQRGATLTAGDLAAVEVAPGQRLSALASPSQIIGKVATVTLPKGSLVTPSSVADALPIPKGQALVGVALKPSQIPSVPLNPGDSVEIVPIAAQQGSVPAGQEPPSPVKATVATAAAPNASTGLTVVNVYVPQSVAAGIAGRAAAGMVTLYVDGAGR